MNFSLALNTRERHEKVRKLEKYDLNRVFASLYLFIYCQYITATKVKVRLFEVKPTK